MGPLAKLSPRNDQKFKGGLLDSTSSWEQAASLKISRAAWPRCCSPRPRPNGYFWGHSAAQEEEESVPAHSLHSLQHFLLILEYFSPEVLLWCLLGSAVPCGGSIGTSCVRNGEIVASYGGHPCSTLLPASGHLHPPQSENVHFLRAPNYWIMWF